MPIISGAQIRAAREALGLSQAVLSALAGVNPALVSQFECGTYKLSPASQRELLLTLQAVECLVQLFPVKLDLRDAAALRTWLDRLHAGEFSGYARLVEEAKATREQIRAAGEAAEEARG